MRVINRRYTSRGILEDTIYCRFCMDDEWGQCHWCWETLEPLRRVCATIGMWVKLEAIYQHWSMNHPITRRDIVCYAIESGELKLVYP